MCFPPSGHERSSVLKKVFPPVRHGRELKSQTLQHEGVQGEQRRLIRRGPMIVEHRTYQLKPGKVTAYFECYQ